MIDGLKARNAGPLPTDSVAPIWREIMSACRALETPTRVAYLGPAGTFSEQAALGYFGSSIVRVPCANVDEVFHATSAGAADFGVVPVENNTEGVVARSLDLFLTMPLFIVGETSLFVRHNLLRRTTGLDGIEAVVAHPQALAQCHGWLSLNLPDAERRPVASNAEGARLAGQDAELGGIASKRAAGEFGLHVVAPAIQDEPTTAPASRSSRTPTAIRSEGVGPRLHEPGGVGAEPAGRRARHAGAAEGARRVDDALRVAPGALGPVGVLLLHRRRGPPDEPEGRRGAARAARGVRVLQGARAPIPSTRTRTEPPRSLRRCPRGAPGPLGAARHGLAMFHQLGVIGCGLMGGSFALALKRAGLVKRVIGYSKSPSTTEQAKRMGVIDVAAESALLAVSGSDIVLLAVPVSATEVTFKAIRHLVEPGVLFMDVGSTKRDVVDAARRVLKERVPSLRAGAPDHRQGSGRRDNADAALFRPPGDPDAVATNVARAGAEGHRRVGGDRRAGAAHDAGEPRCGVCRGEPSAASAGVRLLQRGGQPACGARLPVARPAPAFATSRASRPVIPTIWRDILMANREEILKQTRVFATRSMRWSR